ncbi:MAG TPA: hypothetical protein VH853_04770 [Polyangia bacterium]|nr:hypothetical protein [Polyangia bacterium]
MRALVPSSSDYVGPARERRAEGRSLFQRQLRVIREMLEDMQPQTVAGQRHTMEKVVAFLRSHVGPDAIFVTLRNGLELSLLVDQLEQETRRQIPDLRLFSDRAEALVLLLSATA